MANDRGKPAPAHLAEAFLELQKLARNRPPLEGSAGVLAAILRGLFEQPILEATPYLSADVASEKLSDGIPVLRDVAIAIDAPSFEHRWLAVCVAMKQTEADALAEAVRKRTLDPIAQLHGVLAGRLEVVVMQAEPLGLDPSLAATVLRLTSLPLLAKFAAALAPMRSGISWDHGYCPICGSWPLLAEARGLEQLRFLRCGLCASEWEGSRFRCVFCDNQDHRELGYFHVEGEEDRCRAATCDACRGYVKVVSSLSLLTAPQLLVADLASLHLDLIAAERGFLVSGLQSEEHS